MKALVLESKGDLRVRLDHPEACMAADGWVRVQVASCGICGSDLPRAYLGKAYHYPLVMGHELAGFVVEGGSGRYRAGDRVAVFPLIPRNAKDDPAYQSGDYAQCRDYDYLGSRRDGGFAEYVWAPEENLFLVPEHVKTLHAAMTEPAAVALHGVRRFRKLTAGSAGVVFGAGPIGNMTGQWLRIHGADPVFLVDVDGRKLELAERMGFQAVHAGEVNPVEAIRDRLGGEGAAQVVEAVGLPETFLQSVQLAGRGGEVLFMGNLEGEFRMGPSDMSDLLRKELTLYGTWNSKPVPRGLDDWTTVLRYLDRDLQVEPLISDRPRLEDGVTIFESVRHRKAYHNKVIFSIAEHFGPSSP